MDLNNRQFFLVDCCINKCAWCFTTEGMITVGQDEIVLLLEFIDNEKSVPKDIFYHINSIYNDAKKGTNTSWSNINNYNLILGSSIMENGISVHETTNFLGSKNHVGFLYIRSTFQCLQNVIIPKEPYLIGILIHRYVFPSIGMPKLNVIFLIVDGRCLGLRSFL